MQLEAAPEATVQYFSAYIQLRTRLRVAFAFVSCWGLQPHIFTSPNGLVLGTQKSLHIQPL